MTILISTTGERCEEAEECYRMEYQWMGGHDPIRIDSNLAHIDFDDFKNEDLQNAFTYSVQSIGGESSSGTDMSICKSEQLFSSFKIKVNKNAYTLTYSGLGASINQEYPNSGSLPEDGKYTTWSNVMKQRSVEKGERTDKRSWDRQRDKDKDKDRDSRDRSRPGEENNNNMADSTRKSRSMPNISKPLVKTAWAEEEKFTREASTDEPRLLNLYMRGRGDRNSWNGEGGVGWEEGGGREGVLSPATLGGMGVKEKDAINEYLRKSRLTSIDEHTEASSSSSAEESTVRPIPTPRQRSITSMSTTPSVQGTSLQSGPPRSTSPFNQTSSSPSMQGASFISKRRSGNFPELDFLEDDCALWDAFFTNSRTGGKHSSVLRPQLPVEDYLRRAGSASVRDVKSLRVLLPVSQKHLLPSKQTKSPIAQILGKIPLHRWFRQKQVCESLSRLNTSQYTPEKECGGSETLPLEVVKVKEAWAPQPEHIQAYIKHWQRENTGDNNLNLVNNNERSRDEMKEDEGRQSRTRTTSVQRRLKSEEKTMKRRSYHPQDGLSQLLMSPGDVRLSSFKTTSFPKSGSQGNLCDSWSDTNLSPAQDTGTGRKDRSISAEYPFIPSLSFNPHQQNINFDLTHKRGLFQNLYTAVERLLMFQDPSPSYSNRSAARCVLLHEFCPALHAVLEDGLKEEVITSFGRMKTSVWRVIEAIIQAGPGQRATCDLVMLLNTKFSSEEDFKKFSGFIIGMLK
ncbi:uncharacterized protein LOC111700428 [Eurytemora carolleeae]|uniref:uncharacterized protein LOC111700428 n=1 Tax=Eurytemora carolleeae TaxID=1294199 RepID=UPI000C763523|nr:uncharacterized protein LOC111700428 [Eurytemora carolleeae]|eukprot:XP_023327094.1 uncharacterized protein LOC111700428 [Eurytemora affinis]